MIENDRRYADGRFFWLHQGCGTIATSPRTSEFWLTVGAQLIDFAAPREAAPRAVMQPEYALARFEGRDRRHVVVALATDGRRVQIPVHDTGLVDVSLLGILRSLLLELEGLLGLITGSRRENGGTRRDGRG
jgi:hypothetical protein